MTESLSNWQPRQHPIRHTLCGRSVILEPSKAEHGPALWQALQYPEPLQWRYMAYGPFADQAQFQLWINSLVDKPDPLFFTIFDPRREQALGLISLMRIDSANGCVEIGNLNFSPALQRTQGATEAVYLLLCEAFDRLGYRRVEWKCNALNLRSRRAAERFGFSYEGLFRQHMVVKGQNRDSAWFAMLDHEWPHCRQTFECWLAVDNFDPQGEQIHSLTELRQTVQPA